jgi:hypothetical protein
MQFTDKPAALVPLFVALVHAVLVGAAFAELLLIWVVVVKFSDQRQEVIMRAIAAAAGLLLYLGSKTLGVSIPAFMLTALALGGKYTLGIVGAALPILTGWIVAWWLCRYLNSRSRRRDIAVLLYSIFRYLPDMPERVFASVRAEDDE